MIKAPIPQNEIERLKALLEYQVMDTPNEDSFDDLVLMASEICNTPIALVSLLDDKRQWFKSRVGLLASETPRDISFCGHAIQKDEIFVVKDSHKDERFFDNPLVVGPPDVRFYAGAPLITPSGMAIGTLCVIDHQARELSDEQERYLKILSKQVIAQLEIRKSMKKIQESFLELQNLSKQVIDQQDIIKAQEKLAVIGQLSSGVSHEINNPLAIISGSVLIVRTMLQRGDSPEKILGQLGRIDATVSRLTMIGKALRAISSKKAEGFKDVKTIEETFHKMMDEAKKAA